MLSRAKHPQQLVAGGTNVAQRVDVGGKQRKEENMKKTVAILSVRLLAASLLIPSVRAYADDNSPGNRRQREVCDRINES
jgi:hypothetical protein